MRIRNLLILTLLTLPLHAEEFDLHKFAEFAKTNDEFIRKLAGCPPDAIHKEECIPGAGIFDVKLWQKVRRLAKQAFALQEKSQAQAEASFPGSEKD